MNKLFMNTSRRT